MIDILIPEDLYKKIEDRIKGTEFESVSDYAAYVLNEVVSDEEQEGAEETFLDEENEVVKERLRDLGYID